MGQLSCLGLRSDNISSISKCSPWRNAPNDTLITQSKESRVLSHRCQFKLLSYLSLLSISLCFLQFSSQQLGGILDKVHSQKMTAKTANEPRKRIRDTGICSRICFITNTRAKVQTLLTHRLKICAHQSLAHIM